MYRIIGTAGHEALGAHRGLTVAIEALTIARIQTLSLDLAVELDKPNAFLPYAALESISRICANVNTLTLRDKYYPISSHRQTVNDPSFCITKRLFPMLHRLTLDYDMAGMIDSIAAPLKTDVPDITHLTIINFDEDGGWLQASLGRYGGCYSACLL